jgi:hypothetical protein
MKRTIIVVVVLLAWLCLSMGAARGGAAGGGVVVASPQETLTMSATWWVATPTPPVPSVTFAPTATGWPTPEPTSTPIVESFKIYLPEVHR